MLQPQRERIYWQTTEGDQVNVYARPPIPYQIRLSLARSRRHGYEFPFAWRVAMRTVAFPHEADQRDCWKALLAEPSYQALWLAAFERRRYEPMDAVARCSAVLEEADVPDARHRVTEGRRDQAA
jgi:hypothetical protein